MTQNLYSSYENINLSNIEEPNKEVDDKEEDFSCFSKTCLQPRLLTRLPYSLSKSIGERLEVVCLANVLFPTDIEWFLNDVLLSTSADGRILIENSSRQLTITSVKKTDSGKLACVAKNKFGVDISTCNFFVEELK